MIKKISVFLFACFVIFGGIINSSEAQSFPAGCSSTFGYSTTNGAPCTGTATARTNQLAGCESVLGKSTTTGEACSGGEEIIDSLPGCESTYGYSSTVQNLACSGTGVANFDEGSNVGSTIILIIVGLLLITGAYYAGKNHSKVMGTLRRAA